MARAENVQTVSGIAGELLPIYRFVTLQTDGKFDLTDSTDGRADAVTAEAAAADGSLVAIVPCSQPAIMKVEAGEAIAIGSLIACEAATGRAMVASIAGSGRYSMGVAMTAASGAGEIVEVLLHLSANQA